MRFASLGSGSRGNATLVEEGSTTLLIDCGFSSRETKRRLARLGKLPEDLTAILVTHEHADHIGGVGAMARRYKLPVWMSHGTRLQHSCGELPRVECFNSHQAFAIDEISIEAFPVPHDAREPCQFVFGNGRHRLGLLTDCGSITVHIQDKLSGCDALLLECNHDSDMLQNGPYPFSLKQRVAGQLGHLSNAQAAGLLRDIDLSGLRHIVAMHLSEQNNSVARVTESIGAALGCEEQWISVAGQESGLGWRTI